jgi:hypothetical protein
MGQIADLERRISNLEEWQNKVQGMMDEAEQSIQKNWDSVKTELDKALPDEKELSDLGGETDKADIPPPAKPELADLAPAPAAIPQEAEPTPTSDENNGG